MCPCATDLIVTDPSVQSTAISSARFMWLQAQRLIIIIIIILYYDTLALKFSFKLVTFSKSYARKQKLVFFSEHSVE